MLFRSLSVKPSRTLSVLKSAQEHIYLLPKQDQLLWHQTMIRSAVSMHDFEQLQSSIRFLVLQPEIHTKAYSQQYITMLSGMGIYLRRQGYFSQAAQVLSCGLIQPSITDTQRMSLLISKGLSHFHVGQFDTARRDYEQALEIALEIDSVPFQGSIYNTLGIYHLDMKQYDLAEKHLRIGMDKSQQVSRRYGHIIGGIGLMFVALMTENQELYLRLRSPITRLLLEKPNPDQKALLYWLELVFKAQTKERISNTEERRAIQTLNDIVDVKLHDRIVSKLAPILGIDLKAKGSHDKVYQDELIASLLPCRLGDK